MINNYTRSLEDKLSLITIERKSSLAISVVTNEAFSSFVKNNLLLVSILRQLFYVEQNRFTSIKIKVFQLI